MANVDRNQWHERLTAYLDGELGAAETRDVEELLRADPAARALLRELQRTAELIGGLPRHSAPSSLAEELRVRLERDELLGAAEEISPSSRRWRPWVAGLTAVAAMLAVVITGRVWFGWETPKGPKAESGSHENRAEREPAADASVEREERAQTSANNEKAVSSRGELRQPHLGERVADGSSDSRRRDRSTTGLMKSSNETAISAESELADTATDETKLSRESDAEEIRGHRFSTEPVQLRATVSNAKTQEETVNRITSYLVRTGIASLAGSYADSTDRRGGSQPSEFFYLGKSGLNYENPSHRQILIRVRASRIAGLLEELRPTVDERAVTLVDRSSAHEGLADVSAHYRSKSAQTDSDFGPPDDRVASRSSAADELLRFLGLNREWLRRFSEPADSNETPDHERVDRPTSDPHAAANRPFGLDETAPATAPKEATSESADEPSLVARRLREIEKPEVANGGDEGSSAPIGETVGAKAKNAENRFAKNADAEEASAQAGTVGSGASQSLDEYVTLVIELSIAQPAKGPSDSTESQPPAGTEARPPDGVRPTPPTTRPNSPKTPPSRTDITPNRKR